MTKSTHIPIKGNHDDPEQFDKKVARIDPDNLGEIIMETPRDAQHRTEQRVSRGGRGGQTVKQSELS